jgi:hypothetical protein
MAKQKKRSSLPYIICWCGSQLPYKNCHQDRDKQIPPKPYEIQEEIQKALARRYCMHPQHSSNNCSQRIVAAHSVSRSGNLNAIAENGHVMKFRASFQSMLKKHAPRVTAEPIGVNKASTFTGFCQTHDASTFVAIDQPIVSMTDEQIFLTAYRAICRELFTKTAASEEKISKIFRQCDKGKLRAEQERVQNFHRMREIGLEAGCSDLRQAKARYDEVLLQKSYGKISYYLVALDHTSPIVCTIGFLPEIDFQGNCLQTLDDPTAHVDHITCSILTTVSGTAIVFAWLHEKNGACSKLVNSIDRLKPHQLPSAIVRLVFEHGENVFFSQSWWNGLDDGAKQTIERHANSLMEEKNLRLDNSLHILWSVVCKKKVIR